MSRRFTSVLVLLACFGAGLLVAGKIREATEAGAQSPTSARPAVTTPGPVSNGATLDEREMQYLYHEGEDYHFMDTSSYEQIHISSEALGDSVNYLKSEMTIQVEFYGEEPVGIELPQTVDLKVMDTAPGIKGATASAQVKPATLETGLVVQVPPFVNNGDLVRVNTETGEYLSRA
jgi:elongation factor P